MKCQIIFSWKTNKNISKCLLTLYKACKVFRKDELRFNQFKFVLDELTHDGGVAKTELFLRTFGRKNIQNYV